MLDFTGAIVSWSRQSTTFLHEERYQQQLDSVVCCGLVVVFRIHDVLTVCSQVNMATIIIANIERCLYFSALCCHWLDKCEHE